MLSVQLPAFLYRNFASNSNLSLKLIILLAVGACRGAATLNPAFASVDLFNSLTMIES